MCTSIGSRHCKIFQEKQMWDILKQKNNNKKQKNKQTNNNNKKHEMEENKSLYIIAKYNRKDEHKKNHTFEILEIV